MIFRTPAAAFGIIKEIARHLLRRPVVGFVAFARTPAGEVVLIRRGDTGGWALPGGTLEWGETMSVGLGRELEEEAGVRLLAPGPLLGLYSNPGRDPRFHAVTAVLGAQVTAPEKPPLNPLEVLEVRCVKPEDVPTGMSHGMDDIVRRALKGEVFWE